MVFAAAPALPTRNLVLSPRRAAPMGGSCWAPSSSIRRLRSNVRSEPGALLGHLRKRPAVTVVASLQPASCPSSPRRRAAHAATVATTRALEGSLEHLRLECTRMADAITTRPRRARSSASLYVRAVAAASSCSDGRRNVRRRSARASSASDSPISLIFARVARLLLRLDSPRDQGQVVTSSTLTAMRRLCAFGLTPGGPTCLRTVVRNSAWLSDHVLPAEASFALTFACLVID